MATKVPIVAIVGRANVGKSSLFNSVLRRREAIVANEPGTTRDSIMAKASYDDRDFWLVDTAGMKDAEDDFEFTIQEQITQAADAADLILVVVEAHVMLTEEDRRVAKMALRSKKPVLLVINKIDKAKGMDLNGFERLGIKHSLKTSTQQNVGIEDMLATITEQLPGAHIRESSDRIRLAILGRPNVGKSMLFNTLAKKQQAIVADRAGTTRDVNRAVVRYMGRELEILDTAGIRRSGKIEVGVERFSVIRALRAIEEADVCLLLMDSGELNTQLDQKIAGMIKEAGKGLVLVVSKWDSAEKDAFTRDTIAPQIKRNFEFVPWAPLIFTSSITGQNVTKLFDLTFEIADRRMQQIKTSELNRWLRAVTDKHTPAGLKNSQPKMNYMVQETDQSTPTFQIHGRDIRLTHWSYRRYLEREMRVKWDYAGTPIKIWMIEQKGSEPRAPKRAPKNKK